MLRQLKTTFLLGLLPFVLTLTLNCTSAPTPCDAFGCGGEGAGGASTSDPLEFQCGEGLCSGVVGDGTCVAKWECVDNGEDCHALEMIPGWDPNKCVTNACEDGRWVQAPLDYDDGDPCTEDSCHPDVGPSYVQLCDP